MMALDNVLLLPYLSSATTEGRREMDERVAINTQAFVDGHTPVDWVLKTMY